MKKILSFVLLLSLVTSIVSCTEKKPLSVEESSGILSESLEASDPKGGKKDLAETQNNSVYAIDYEKIMGNTDKSKKINILVNETEQTLANKTFTRYMYQDETDEEYFAGMPILLREGQAADVSVINNSGVDTNIHWHGLSLPNDQDGPHLLIEKNGGTHPYFFMPDYAGTYWYHSHNRPVRDQVDFGMYGPLIILDETDAQYDVDQIFVLDDWVINRAEGHMQIEGDVDTVNGLSGDEILPLVLTNNDKAKLRFIQASTAKMTVLTFPFDVLVTHTDGMPVAKPFPTKKLELVPGERYDVEVILDDTKDGTFFIENERNAGMRIPIIYEYDAAAKVPEFSTEFVSKRSIDFSKVSETPDVNIVMSQTMGMGRGHQWTINGEVYPDTEEFDFELGKVYHIRFQNDSRMFNHPMHIHGAHFRLLNHNGKPYSEEIWKDTVNVPPGDYIDVVIVFDNPGAWMLHCHILDHEDGGMMTTIHVA